MTNERHAKKKIVGRLVWSIIVGTTVFGSGVYQAAAQSPGPSGGPPEAKEAEHDAACDATHVKLFSCRLTSGPLVTLCIDERARALQFRLTATRGNPEVLALSNPHQILSVASAGASTILQGQTPRGTATLFLDRNYADAEGSALQFANQTADFCNESTIDVPSLFFMENRSNGSRQLVNIWDLRSIGIATPFYNDDRDEDSLWSSWPSKQP